MNIAEAVLTKCWMSATNPLTSCWLVAEQVAETCEICRQLAEFANWELWLTLAEFNLLSWWQIVEFCWIVAQICWTKFAEQHLLNKICWTKFAEQNWWNKTCWTKVVEQTFAEQTLLNSCWISDRMQ